MEPAKAKPFYKKIQTLGKGQYGKAVLVQNTGTNEMLVMKAVDIAEMTAEEKRDSIKEARILEALFHPNQHCRLQGGLRHPIACPPAEACSTS